MRESEQEGGKLLFDIGTRVDDVGAGGTERRPGRLSSLEGLQVDGYVSGDESVADNDVPALAGLSLQYLAAVANPDPQARAARQVEPLAHLGCEELICLHC